MKLGLFFTLDISLDTWVQLGLLDREKRIYENLLDREAVNEIFWFTYGHNDKSHERLLKKGITVVSMPGIFMGRLGRLLYSIVAPFYLGKYLRQTDLLKSNQMRGSWTAVIASWLYRKPLIIRTGFTWSRFAARRRKWLSLDRFASFFERIAYRAANIAVVASQGDAEYLQSRYHLPSEKLRVIENYVDTSLFKPHSVPHPHQDRIIFVGRLVAQKNLRNLIEAMAGLPYQLDLYHQEDELKNELQELARAVKATVYFKGSVQNNQLSDVLNQYKLFILPSLYEGMPKTLLEAMSCGLAVIGTDVDGIREVIRHRDNGYLIYGTDSVSLKKGIVELASNPSLQQTLGAAARRSIEKDYSLESAVEKEIRVYAEARRS